MLLSNKSAIFAAFFQVKRNINTQRSKNGESKLCIGLKFGQQLVR